MGCTRSTTCRTTSTAHRRRQAAPAAADLLGGDARPGLLRVHPEEGRRRVRRGQFQGAVRVDRARPAAPRRAGDRVVSEARTPEQYQSGFGNTFATEAL